MMGKSKRVSFEVSGKDGTVVDAELFRPASWVDARHLLIGTQIPMLSDELEVNGMAGMVAVDKCPPLACGTGEVITGRFVTRRVDKTVLVKLSNGEMLEGTPIHPIWSPEQEDWVPLGKFMIGDAVLGREGLIRIESMEFRNNPVPVYNLEVHGEHVYQVTEAGILVHNADECLEITQITYRGTVIAEYGPKSGPIHHLATNKNWISDLTGGPWSPRFNEIFAKAGMTLEDIANKVRIPGHAGPHPEAYHTEIYRRLQAATDGLVGGDYKAALLKELEVLAAEALSLGTNLNRLLTGG